MIACIAALSVVVTHAQDTPVTSDTTEPEQFIAPEVQDTTGVQDAPALLDTVAEDGAAEPDTAATPVRFDSSVVRLQRPSQGMMDRFASDDDFAYDRRQRAPETLWDRIMEWIFSIPQRILGSQGASDAWDYAGKIIAVAALVFVILKLTQTDLRGVFTRGTRAQAGPFVESDENIHEMNFDALIDEAVRDSNYRRAIRLLYLKQMKALADHGLIAWRIDKTNDDYARELAATPLRNGFREIRRVFEYVWYGDLPVDAAVYRTVQEHFVRFGSMVGRER